MGTLAKLSQNLNDLRFFCAFGTTERCGGDESIVKAGTPFTIDYNNGVTVIYDELGRPWILRGDHAHVIDSQIRKVIMYHRLQHGAYVPHSNDGGYFVREVLPEIERGLADLGVDQDPTKVSLTF